MLLAESYPRVICRAQQRTPKKQIQSDEVAESLRAMQQFDSRASRPQSLWKTNSLGSMGVLRQLMRMLLPKHFASASRALHRQEIELIELGNSPKPRHSGNPGKRVRFQEAIEQIALKDQTVVRIDRAAVTDMRLAQQDLDGLLMPGLQQRVNALPQGDVQDLVREALQCYQSESAREDRAVGLGMLSHLLRGHALPDEENTSQALNQRLFRSGASLAGVARTLKLALEETEYRALPKDEWLTETQATIEFYLGAIEQAVVSMPVNDTPQVDDSAVQEGHQEDTVNSQALSM